MNRTRIKICGITHPEDAALASSAGADAIGMIFHPPARRNIDLQRAREIMAAIGPFVTAVGVFVDAPADRILAARDAVGFAVAQLHGHEPPDTVVALLNRGLRVLKAVRVDATFEEQLDAWRGSGVAGLVLETGGAAGGSGIVNDWTRVRAVQDAGRFAGLPPIIAAGGLSPASVADVVRQVAPWAVDVSSGVENAPGRKSAGLIQSFVAAVRSADPSAGPAPASTNP